MNSKPIITSLFLSTMFVAACDSEPGAGHDYAAFPSCESPADAEHMPRGPAGEPEPLHPGEIENPDPPICEAPAVGLVDVVDMSGELIESTTDDPFVEIHERFIVVESGRTGEVLHHLRPDGTARVELTLDGEVAAWLEVDNLGGEPVNRSWFSSDIASADMTALLDPIHFEMAFDELTAGPLAGLDCSEFGKGVVAASKYAALFFIGAAGAACCVEAGLIGCAVCGGAAAAAGNASTEMHNNHCN